MAKQIALLFIYLGVFLGIYTAFTNATVYHATLSHVIKPYKGGVDKSEGRRVDEPYTPITKENLQHWDARSYYQIGKYGYIYPHTTAFFPLFPLVFKLTGFSWLIIVVNFLLFGLSLLYLYRHIGHVQLKESTPILLLLLSLPSAFVFLIPYSESLFFFCFTLCIAGFYKGNKYLLFAGLLLAAATRPIVTIVLLSIVSAEVIRLLYTRSSKAVVNSLAAISTSHTGRYIYSGLCSISRYRQLLQFYHRSKRGVGPLLPLTHPNKRLVRRRPHPQRFYHIVYSAACHLVLLYGFYQGIQKARATIFCG
ncbi:MAG: hypothetical protein M0D57_17230 [Sphingobacteriales bacterium JAD_PAG50586_3]|nr:MAG: hypothetical protein M0D57_17230 [Sphingobacteriales bacterium JAD_PAG50586_3]